MSNDNERPLEPTDGATDERRRTRPTPFALPDILELQSSRVRFQTPRAHYVESERLEASAGVEFVLQTSGPIPIRAASALLLVGDVAIDAYEEVGRNRYRFTAFDVEDLRPGAPISLGWSAAGGSQIETRFHYEPGDTEEQR